MKLTLRSQLAFVAGLFIFYAGGVGFEFRVRARAHERLESQLHRSLAVLTNLPRLRDQLRRVDQATGQYLLSGNRVSLDRRDEAVDQIRKLEQDLSPIMNNPSESALLDAMDQRLTSYLAQTSPLVSRRRAGRLSGPDAARAARGRGLEAAVEPLSTLGSENATKLRARGAELEAVSDFTSLVIFGVGALTALIIALFLSVYLTGPVIALRDHAREWTLGQDWKFPKPLASPEVADLADAMSEMAQRLNAQFAREAEFGKLKGSLVSMASHEFNNVLSVLSGAANLLRATENPPPTGRRAEYYVVIESNLRALALATSNLLDLGRVEDGKFAVRPRRCEPGESLMAAAQALKPVYEKKNIAFELDAPASLPPVSADPEALNLISTNLIGNAVKYTPEGGRVRAGVMPAPQGGLQVYVEDTGIGIAAKDVEWILTGHRTEEGKKAASGFGVGLVLVQRLLEAHNVKLDLESTPGKGSRFSFILPAWTKPTSADLFA